MVVDFRKRFFERDSLAPVGRIFIVSNISREARRVPERADISCYDLSPLAICKESRCLSLA